MKVIIFTADRIPEGASVVETNPAHAGVLAGSGNLHASPADQPFEFAALADDLTEFLAVPVVVNPNVPLRYAEAYLFVRDNRTALDVAEERSEARAADGGTVGPVEADRSGLSSEERAGDVATEGELVDEAAAEAPVEEAPEEERSPYEFLLVAIDAPVPAAVV